MERSTEHREEAGFSAGILRFWGYLFLLGGIAATFIQNRLLGISGMTGPALLALMDQGGRPMALITASLLLQAMESCAVPLFALLTVEGFCKTANCKGYLGALVLVAAASEIPFDLAFSGRVLDLSTRNPAFGLVIALVMLWFYRYSEEKGGKTGLMKLIITVAAVLWCGMLSVRHGTFLVVMTAVLYLLRSKPYKLLLGALAAAAGCLISIYYAVAPISFLAIYFYNSEKEDGSNRAVALATYPALLLLGCGAMLLL